VATLALALMGLAAIVAISGVRVARQPPGYVGVVRNGGPFDDRAIRQILLPGQRITWIGFFSQTPHDYPSVKALRALPVGDDLKSPLSLPTRDGVQVVLQATAFFRFVGESNPDLLKRFDLTIGTRKFNGLYPWEGDDGFMNTARALITPVLENNLRREVGAVPCASLVASCSLIRRAEHADDPNATIARIQHRINASLEHDLAETLSQPFFHGFRFRIVRVVLPPLVQAAVDQTQAKYAAINGARADLRRARYQARSNDVLGDSYNRSPSLARIDAIKAAPPGATIVVGSGQDPQVLVGGNSGAEAPGATPTPGDEQDGAER
jgi:regulator of protease activity HflC (stomatin/prohibitin superfamily)